MPCYKRVEKAIGDAFDRYGRFVFRNPIQIIVVVIILNGGLGVGMMTLKQDTDVSRVYTPMNSQASKDEERLLTLFPDTSSTDFYSYQRILQPKYATVLVRASSGNVLDPSIVASLIHIHMVVNNISVTNPFQDVCAKRSGQCVIDGDIFWLELFNASLHANNVSYPIFIDGNRVPVNLEPLLGDVSRSPALEAAYLKLQFNLKSDTIISVDDLHNWQEEFVKQMKQFQDPNIDIAFAHSESLGDELNANIGGDISLFSVTFTLMITYACFATFSASNDCVGRCLLQYIEMLHITRYIWRFVCFSLQRSEITKPILYSSKPNDVGVCRSSRCRNGDSCIVWFGQRMWHGLR